ncbi:MAG: hypothetical protein N2690_06260 [Rhodocyclaceae bacterium]|nr:hypothetical protein [Rhodocyclaceae bacterium]
MSIALRILVANRQGAAALPAVLDTLRRQRAQASFIAPPARLAALRPAAEAGHEIGLVALAPPTWWSRLRAMQPAQQQVQIEAAIATYTQIFGAAPRLNGGCEGWLTAHPLRLTQRLGFAYASDTRGRHPFVPVWNGEIVRCPQFPVTLPTFEELALPRAAWGPAVAQLLDLTAQAPGRNQLFALTAGPSLVAQLGAWEELLTGWREQGHDLVAIQSLAAASDVDKLPRHEVILGKVPGRPDALLLQGEAFLSNWSPSA